MNMALIDLTDKEIPKDMSVGNRTFVNAIGVGFKRSEEEINANLEKSIIREAPQNARGYILLGPSDPVESMYYDSFGVEVQYVF